MSPKKKHAGDRPGPPPSRRKAEGKARLIEKAREVVYLTPEVRPEKVARLKEAIEQGNYKIDSRRLADIILKEWLIKR
jgi:flagellar biosynthesis anti-sigma factor FlgM